MGHLVFSVILASLVLLLFVFILFRRSPLHQYVAAPPSPPSAEAVLKLMMRFFRAKMDAEPDADAKGEVFLKAVEAQSAVMEILMPPKKSAKGVNSTSAPLAQPLPANVIKLNPKNPNRKPE